MKYLHLIFMLIILSNCSTFSDLEAPVEEKGTPGLFSKDSKKRIKFG